MKKFSKGTVVEIVDVGEQYTTYWSWVSKNAPEYFDAWYNRKNVLKHEDAGKHAVVIKHAPHNRQNTELYLIFINNEFQLIGHKGLKRAYKPCKPFVFDGIGNTYEVNVNND